MNDWECDVHSVPEMPGEVLQVSEGRAAPEQGQDKGKRRRKGWGSREVPGVPDSGRWAHFHIDWSTTASAGTTSTTMYVLREVPSDKGRGNAHALATAFIDRRQASVRLLYLQACPEGKSMRMSGCEATCTGPAQFEVKIRRSVGIYLQGKEKDCWYNARDQSKHKLMDEYQTGFKLLRAGNGGCGTPVAEGSQTL